jgi:hypothetical protein
MTIKRIFKELRNHLPFTLLGAFSGIVVMIFFSKIPKDIAYNIFYILHPTHVLLSALVTSAMYKLYKCGKTTIKCNLFTLLLIGYVGSVGIATISDSIIPYIGELFLNMPDRNIHLGFIEKWWIVNPLAIIGISIAYFWPHTKFPHFGHVLISTWASLFHILMAIGKESELYMYFMVFIFLFFAVWIPCCISDIVFPLLFVNPSENKE